MVILMKQRQSAKLTGAQKTRLSLSLLENYFAWADSRGYQLGSWRVVVTSERLTESGSSEVHILKGARGNDRI
jgi:hypothetical protein